MALGLKISSLQFDSLPGRARKRASSLASYTRCLHHQLRFTAFLFRLFLQRSLQLYTRVIFFNPATDVVALHSPRRIGDGDIVRGSGSVSI